VFETTLERRPDGRFKPPPAPLIQGGELTATPVLPLATLYLYWFSSVLGGVRGGKSAYSGHFKHVPNTCGWKLRPEGDTSEYLCYAAAVIQKQIK